MTLDKAASTDKLVYKTSKVYFGKEDKNLNISKETQQVIFDTLSQAMNQSSFKFSNDGTLTISFDGLINTAINSIDTSNPISAQYKTFLQNNADLKVVIEGNNVTDNSLVKIQAKRR